MNVLHNAFPSIQAMQDQYLAKSPVKESESSLDFGSILSDKARDDNNNGLVKFSKHATNRLEQRNIELSDSQLERLNEGTRKASGKGINESLIMIDQLAFIVNVPNSTVITAMDQTETDNNIFTNIDGAVIM